jgi:hypothetical protein
MTLRPMASATRPRSVLPCQPRKDGDRTHDPICGQADQTDQHALRFAGRALSEVDERYHPAAGLRRQLNKVFPTHWSFLIGEIALYSFIVLLLSGTYLALFFDPR